jgi:hypothetical protein
VKAVFESYLVVGNKDARCAIYGIKQGLKTRNREVVGALFFVGEEAKGDIVGLIYARNTHNMQERHIELVGFVRAV